MKLKNLLAVCCCAALAAFSTLTVFAEPDDSSYLDDIYNWISSTVSEAIGDDDSSGYDDYNSDDYSSDDYSSDYDDYYDDYQDDENNYDDTSSDNTSHEDGDEYYENQTEPYYEETEPQEDSGDNWYDWFSVSQEETEPETETIPETDSAESSTTEYVGYGFFMWVVIIVGVIITLAIITNTHLRKKS